MGFTGVLTSRLFLIRTAMGLLALLYLFVIIASHSIPLSSALEVPLAAAGWVALVLFVLTSFQRLTSEGLNFVPRMSWSYRQFPYDSAGNDDPGAAWVEISRPEYVAEVGTRLRQGASFGVGALCLAWLLAGTFARDGYDEDASFS